MSAGPTDVAPVVELGRRVRENVGGLIVGNDAAIVCCLVVISIVPRP